jgi:hypothetical protein
VPENRRRGRRDERRPRYAKPARLKRGDDQEHDDQRRDDDEYLDQHETTSFPEPIDPDRSTLLKPSPARKATLTHRAGDRPNA